MMVFDGADTSAPVLGTFTGTTIPTQMTSTGGSMLVWFLSDELIRSTGWSANYSSLITDVDEPSKELLLRVYPNPSSGAIWIEVGSSSDVDQINVINSLGKTVWSIQSPPSGLKNAIEIIGLSPGIYFINVLSGSGVRTKRVVITQ